MSRLYTFPLKVKLRAPFIFRGLSDSAFGVDVAAIRNLQGQAIIPRSHIKGYIRHGLQQLEGKDSLLELLGKSSEDDTGKVTNKPHRGRLFFEDMILANEDGKSVLATTRVAIEEETGAAKPGALLVIEQVCPAGTYACFEGRIHYFGEEKIAKALHVRLEKALWMTPAMGGLKSAGYGFVEEIELGPGTSEQPQPSSFEPRALAGSGYQILGLRFTLNQPYLCDKVKITENIFSGRECISGGSLKGALARKLELMERMNNRNSEILACMHFSEALTPLKLPYQLRTRVKIKEDDSYSAEKSMLFSQQEFTHLQAEGQPRGFCCFICWPQERDATPILNMLSGGLFGLGATGAIATFAPSRRSVEAMEKAYHADYGGKVTLELKTEALILDCSESLEQKNTYELLLDYFKKALGDGVRLEDYAIKLAVHGGSVSFRKRLYGDNTYAPYVLLAPKKSWFTLSGFDAEKLKNILVKGLPVFKPKDANQEPNWENCYYLPENGFGAVCVKPAKMMEGGS